jgi:pseudouridine synthase
MGQKISAANMKIILPKIIALSGCCSRRKAEELIKTGLVKINGRIALVGEQANPEKDKITIKGKLISNFEQKVYLKLNKPLNYTCTNRKFPGERNIFELISLPFRLFAVGRLDKNSRGLVLLTNDGDLAQKLSHPKYEREKVYEVKVGNVVKAGDLIAKKLIGGIKVNEEDGVLHAKKAQYLQNNFFIITLSEGKKRQIRKMFEALDLEVIDLRRIALASLELGDLKEGRWVYLSQEEINNLKI